MNETELLVENEKLKAALEVAHAENETLWEVIERDRARVQAERAAYQRDAADAENAGRRLVNDGDE